MQLLLPSYRYYLVLRRLCLILGLLLIALIFVLADSSLATGTINFKPPLDKLLHAGVYGSIAALLSFSGAGRHALLVWLGVIVVGLLDEWQQVSIVGRVSSSVDLLADIAGVTLGVWIAGLLVQCIAIRPE